MQPRVTEKFLAITCMSCSRGTHFIRLHERVYMTLKLHGSERTNLVKFLIAPFYGSFQLILQRLQFLEINTMMLLRERGSTAAHLVMPHLAEYLFCSILQASDA